MRLSKNFTLEEFLQSQTAARKGIDMTPPPEVIDNLQELVTHLMQPLREAVDSPIRITSGFRPLELNTEIGGSKTSQHMEGKAADLQVPGWQPIEVCTLAVHRNLPFDQLIHEFCAWVHASYNGEANRFAKLTAKLVNGGPQYMHGFS